MNSSPRFTKTAKAWEILQKPSLIGVNAHALLLMANGQRSDEELSLLLGGDVSSLALDLQSQGYLQAVEPTQLADSDDEFSTLN